MTISNGDLQKRSSVARTGEAGTRIALGFGSAGAGAETPAWDD
jgi:hypothetical protein